MGSLLFDIATRNYINISLKEAISHFESTNEAITTIRNDLEKLLSEKKIRLFILIDDLDRCSFETMIAIIESIKIFLNSRGVIFIIAADNDKLQQAWKNRYPLFKEDEANEYFDKFFQLKIKLPLKGTIHIEDYLKRIHSFLPKKLETLLTKSMDNPRKIKQILNKIFFLLKYNDFLKDKSNQDIEEYLTAITIWSVIITVFPELSRKISKNMISLLDLLVIVNYFQNYELLETGFERTIGKYNASEQDSSTGVEGALISKLPSSTRSCINLIIKSKKIYEFIEIISKLFGLEQFDKNQIDNYVTQRRDKNISQIMKIKDVNEANSFINRTYSEQGTQSTKRNYYASFPQKYKELYILLVDVIEHAKILYS